MSVFGDKPYFFIQARSFADSCSGNVFSVPNKNIESKAKVIEIEIDINGMSVSMLSTRTPGWQILGKMNTSITWQISDTEG